jgi:hypothetical protein
MNPTDRDLRRRALNLHRKLHRMVDGILRRAHPRASEQERDRQQKAKAGSNDENHGKDTAMPSAMRAIGR